MVREGVDRLGRARNDDGGDGKLGMVLIGWLDGVGDRSGLAHCKYHDRNNTSKPDRRTRKRELAETFRSRIWHSYLRETKLGSRELAFIEMRKKHYTDNVSQYNAPYLRTDLVAADMNPVQERTENQP